MNFWSLSSADGTARKIQRSTFQVIELSFMNQYIILFQQYIEAKSVVVPDTEFSKKKNQQNASL